MKLLILNVTAIALRHVYVSLWHCDFYLIIIVLPTAPHCALKIRNAPNKKLRQKIEKNIVNAKNFAHK